MTESTYLPRTIDAELNELLRSLPAISLDGPRGSGKTSTAKQFTNNVIELDDNSVRGLVKADPSRITNSEELIVVDEWQRYPELWDRVRRAVDNDNSAGRFLLTGSAAPSAPPTHTGAGRIVGLRMRPFGLHERNIQDSPISLQTIISGERPAIDGESTFKLSDYLREIIAGGFPGMRHLEGRAHRLALDSYLERVIDKDFHELHDIRNPALLKRWLASYAAATSTTSSYETIRDSATAGEGDKPSKTTTSTYRDILEKIWIVDPVPAWNYSSNPLNRLIAAPKHHLADPALAARAMGYSFDSILSFKNYQSLETNKTASTIGQLFESLVVLTIRTLAQQAEAKVFHLRDKGGHREIDIIIERSDHKIIAVEIQLSETIDSKDVRHLKWLQEKLGEDLVDSIVVNTGKHAYRRKDGIAIIPAALLT